MKMKLVLSILLLAMALGLPAALLAADPKLPPEAAKVAQDFVSAFVRNDRGAISGLLPKQLHNLYGPSPFSRMPQLIKPRADSRMGVIEFRGGRADSSLPERGMIVLRKVEEGTQISWRVRQVYWYDELPPDARIPQESPTAADRKEEPRITAAAKEFVHTWMIRDYEKLHAQVFHWWEVNRRAPGWVKLSRVNLNETGPSLSALRVTFTAKLRLLGALPKSVDGTLWLVQEEGKWRVRPLTVAFEF